MKTLLLGGAAAVALVAVGPAAAQPAPPPAPPPAPAPQVHVMHMPMKVQTRDEAVQRVRDHFTKLDTNRDGVLTREEADAARSKIAGERREKVARRLAEKGANRGAAFDRLDTNKDGSISREEFAAGRQVRRERVIVMRDGETVADSGAPGAPGARVFRMHRMGGLGRLHGRMFDQADANRDGRVTLQEATDAALRHFDMADANRDGRLTPEERMQVRQRIRIQRERT